MSASNANSAAAARQVPCETLESDLIHVDLDVLLLSGTFKEMYDDLGLQEQDVFPGVFPVKNVSTCVFKKVIDWCKEHKGGPEPVVEKDPLTQECKWFTLTDYEKDFFDVPMQELLKLVKAANFLDIHGLYHYACQSVAARIKGKNLGEICKLLRQHCDLGQAGIRKIRTDNPWLSSVFSGARMKNTIFIPNEVLLTIFEKLPREDLERLQLVSTQFNGVIVSSSKLSEQQGPLRVITKVEFGAYSRSLFSQKIDVWLRDGTKVSCPDFDNLAKRLKFSVVQKMRAGFGGAHVGIQELSKLLPAKSSWKDATVQVCYAYGALYGFAFTRLLLCMEIVLGRERGESVAWSRAYMRLPGIAACNKLNVGSLNYHYGGNRIHPSDVVEWLEHEVPAQKWSEPRELVIDEQAIDDNNIYRLLTALKTAFSRSNSPKPYVVRILSRFYPGAMNEVLSNETTHEALIIRAERYGDVLVVKRA